MTLTASATLTVTPAPPTLNGPIYQNGGTAVFTGTGAPGELIYILQNGSPYGPTVTVGPNGTFEVTVPSAGISAGDIFTAAGGSPTGPTSGAITAVVGSGVTPVANSPIAGGAGVVPVSGAPGDVVVIVDSSTQQVLGTGVVGSNGQVGVNVNPLASPGSTLEILVGGVPGTPIVVGPAGSAPQVSVVSGAVLVNGSTVSGTGIPGETIVAVDSAGGVLGSAVVDSAGNFVVPISGVTAGRGVVLVQNGVKTTVTLKSANLGSETAFLSTNVFKPLQGGSLAIGFKALNDDHITVKVFTLSGSMVRSVLDLDVKGGVIYSSSWDGKNMEGSIIASGIYFVSIHGARQSTIKKVIVLK
jgi:hypothetical protein